MSINQDMRESAKNAVQEIASARQTLVERMSNLHTSDDLTSFLAGGKESVQLELKEGHFIGVDAKGVTFYRATTESERYGQRDPDHFVGIPSADEMLTKIGVRTMAQIKAVDDTIDTQINNYYAKFLATVKV